MTDPALPGKARPGSSPASWAFFVLVGFILGNGTGYLAGVVVGSRPRGPDTGGIDSEPTTEKPADLAHPRFLEGRGWSVSYPSNWTLSAASAGDDPDHGFVLESPGLSSVRVAVRDEPCELTQELSLHIVGYANRVVESPVPSDLASWGRYPGRGQELRGRLLGGGPGTVRVFVANVGGRSFTAIETAAEDDSKAVDPGFRLVEDSFTLK